MRKGRAEITDQKKEEKTRGEEKCSARKKGRERIQGERARKTEEVYSNGEPSQEGGVGG